MKDLNELELKGIIDCPWCERPTFFVYKEGGLVSIPCPKCHKMVVWDASAMIAEKALIKKSIHKVTK